MGRVAVVQKGREFKLQLRCLGCQTDSYPAGLYEEGETQEEAVCRHASSMGVFICDRCPSEHAIVVGIVRAGRANHARAGI